jgi:hypothetical protein
VAALFPEDVCDCFGVAASIGANIELEVLKDQGLKEGLLGRAEA